VILYDSAGSVRYPSAPQVQSSDQAAGSSTWQEAWKLEYEQAEPARAAAEYSKIAQQSPHSNIAAEALQAQARCLAKAGDKQAAIEILIGPLADSKYHSATSSDRTILCPPKPS
jgi:hypothetical protein